MLTLFESHTPIEKMDDGSVMMPASLFYLGWRFDPVNKGISRAEDPNEKFFQDLDIINPNYPAAYLAELKNYLGILEPCVDAMSVFIDGRGYELIPRFPEDKLNASEKTESDQEWERLRTLFDFCNATHSFTKLRKELRKDLEYTGRMAMEVVRDKSGEIREFHRVSPKQLYLTRKDSEPTRYDQPIRDKRSGKYQLQTRFRRFKRYVQIINANKIFFKEFGDPRNISYKTGKPTSKSSDDLATEIIYVGLFSTYDDLYGEPRWIGNLTKILGHWQAEKTNYFYFKNRAMPEYMITVAGGHLTSDTKKSIKNRIEQLRGPENFGKQIIIESSPQSAGKLAGEKLLQPRIEVVPLTGTGLQDALFQGFQEKVEKAVRTSFKLSPILIGMSEDHTQATARAALISAEQHVFAPERQDFDEIVNNRILADLGINYWTFKSMGNKTTDNTMVARVLAPYKDICPSGKYTHSGRRLPAVRYLNLRKNLRIYHILRP